MKIRTHYDNLGVARNAQPEVIKAAYKALAQKYHPDRNPNNPDAERIMKIINTAYRVLIDPVLRAEHDAWIVKQEQEQKRQQQHTQSSQSKNQSTHHTQSSTQQPSYQSNTRNERDDKYDKRSDSSYHDNYDTYNNPNSEMAKFLYGRMRRTTYAVWFIPAVIIWFFIRIGSESVTSTANVDMMSLVILTIFEIISWLVLLIIAIKRLHDCNYKGWWALVPFVVIAILFVKGTKGTNRFGDDPRPKNSHLNQGGEIETDLSLLILFALSVLLNVSILTSIHEQIKQNQDNLPTVQDQTPSNNEQIAIQQAAPTISPNTTNINSKEMHQQAKTAYDNAVANINSIWNSLHPSTQDFLRAEQRAINKKREADCTAYGNAQSTDKDLARAYRYACEVPQLNERAEYLKTQLNTVVTPPKPDIQPQPLPQTGATNKPNLHGNSPLQIKTNSGNHYWVKIVNAYNEKEEVVSYFIRGGETLDVNLPMGKYVVKYAYGDTWYGREHLFGENTGYSKADEVLEFYHGQGYIIELIQQLNGNLHTTAIDESQF